MINWNENKRCNTLFVDTLERRRKNDMLTPKKKDLLFRGSYTWFLIWTFWKSYLYNMVNENGFILWDRLNNESNFLHVSENYWRNQEYRTQNHSNIGNETCKMLHNYLHNACKNIEVPHIVLPMYFTIFPIKIFFVMFVFPWQVLMNNT